MAKRKTIGKDGVWKPKRVRYEFTKEKLTASMGLGPMIDAFVQSPQFEKLRRRVPERTSNASYDSMQFVLTLMSGFWYGYDCLDDLEKLEKKPDLTVRLESLPKPRAIGDYLRSFEEENFDQLNDFLTDQGFAARKHFAPDAPFVLDQDSTAHEQSGKEIEGLEKNYKGIWCLDSLDSYDDLGFCYGFKLRPGATFSSQGAPKEIQRIFSRMKFKEEKYYRADSAFCNQDCIGAVLLHGGKFTITAHDNIKWEEKIDRIENWEKWQYTQEEIQKAENSGKELPEVEVGSMLYRPTWSENLRFHVVVKRTKAKKQEQTTLFEQQGYKHWGVLTNFNLYNTTKQKIIEWHSKRGNAENFIREQKISYDLKHFPCMKLNANRAYGYFAQISHNFLRTIARLDNPDKPHFAKKIRDKYIFIPAKVILNKANYTVIRIPEIFRKEVERLTTGWAGTLQSALDTG